MSKKEELTTEDVALAFEPIREYSELKKQEAEVKARLNEVGGRLRTFFAALNKQAGTVHGLIVMSYQKTAGFAEARFRKENPELADEFTRSSTVLSIEVEDFMSMCTWLGNPLCQGDERAKTSRRMISLITGSREELDVKGLLAKFPHVADPYVTRVLKVDHAAVSAAADLIGAEK